MIHLTYPYIPPSINRAYGTNKFGAFYSNKVVDSYKDNFITFAKDNWLSILNSFKFEEEDVFHLTVNFFFPAEELINYKFGKDKRIKSAYKRLDLDNRRKVLQDVLCSIFGIDDTRIFSSSDAKYISTEKRVEIYLDKTNIKDYEVECTDSN